MGADVMSATDLRGEQDGLPQVRDLGGDCHNRMEIEP